MRIAFLGGSLVQLASTFDTTLPGALKILLQRRYPGRDIEVINAGIQSCVSRQSIAQLVFSVVDYHPDIVILYDGGNDIGLPLTYESRPNFPYNFQTMEEAWDLYRQERRAPRFERIARFVRSVIRGDGASPVPVVVQVGLAEENLANNRVLHGVLREQGYPARLVETPGGHDWPTWKRALDPHLVDHLRRLWR